MAASSGLVAACAGRTSVPQSDSTRAVAGAGVTPTTSVPATASAAASLAEVAAASALPAAHPWVARRGEVQPTVKARATSLLEAVGTWTAGQGDLASARRRAAAAGHAPTLADGLTVLLGNAESAVTVVRDAQYGGILTGAASVLVLADQWRDERQSDVGHAPLVFVMSDRAVAGAAARRLGRKGVGHIGSLIGGGRC